MNLETLASVCSGFEADLRKNSTVPSKMGTVETRSSKTLASSPESDKTKSPSEKALKKVKESLSETNSGSVIEGLLGGVTHENGVKTGSGEKKEIKIASKDSVSGEKDGRNGVSLAENEVKHNGSVSESEDVEQGQEFCVGDFVWGKIKSHPWWPGQIYDPSQASDFAAAKMRHGAGDHLYLVAYFGDGTFAWCRPSQLKPFDENILAMSRQSNARSFGGAVRRAMDEIAGALERTLTCPCVPESNRVGLGRSVAENSGVKEGSLVPVAKIGKLSDFLSEPSEILSLLRQIAQDVHGVREEVVQVGILRSRLSAFFRSKGVCELPRYLDPVPVPGLEDKKKKLNVVEVPARGPFEDWPTQISQADRPPLQSCQIDSEGKRTPRRKQMSIAELIAREGTSPKENAKTKLTSESREAKESSGGSKGKKSKKEIGIVKSSGKPQFEKSPSFREKKKSKYLSPPFIVTSGSKKKLKESETEVPEVSTPKDVGPKTSGDKSSHQETKAEVSTNEVLSEVRSAAANPLSQREKDSVEKVVDFMSAFRGSVYSDGTNPRSRKKKKRKSEESESVAKDQDDDEKKRKFPESKSGGKDPNDEKKRKSKRKFPESKSGGKDPNDEKKRKSPETKSSGKYPNDENKRKSLESKSGGKDPNDEKKRTSPKSKSGRKDPDVHSERKQSVKARGRKRKQETSNPEETVGEKSEAEVKTPELKSTKKKQKKVETRKEIVEEKILPATLIVEFAPASTLPTKSDLIKIYGKYGELDEVKTDMYYNNKCARIYFLNGSNAESAYKDSKSTSPFGSNSVEFVLECPSHEYKTRELNEITPTKEAVVETPKKEVSKSKLKEKSKENGGPGIGYVKQKLERISKMLEGEISEKWRSKLKREVSGLSEKVNTMAGSSN